MLVHNSDKIYIGQIPIKKVYNGIEVVYNNDEPSGYTELQCIESTGTQYIDTGISPTVNHIIEIDFQYTSNTTTTGSRLLGSRENWHSKGFYVGTGSNTVGNVWWMELSSSYYSFSGIASDLNRHKIKFGKQVYIDDTLSYTFNNPSSFNAYANIMLFGSFDGDTSTTEVTKTAYKLYSCKIWDDTTLVRDFIPVLDNQNVPCLYDNVTEQYFYNNGTGTFLYEEIPSYTELTYIQSSGTQYINTGYYPTGDTKYEFAFSDATSAGVVCGAYNGAWTSGNGFYHNTNSKEWFHYLSNTQTNFNSLTSGKETVVMDKYQVYINGNSSGSAGSAKTFTLTYPMYIFTGNWSGRIEQPLTMKLHYFKIIEDDDLIHDFIPVLDPEDVPCLYDKVTETYFYNQGTGTFGYVDPRPEPPPEPVPMPTGYTQLKSIIAHGTQRINTGIIPNDNTYGFEAKFCLENGEDEGLWDWNILNMGGTSVDNYRFGFGGWKALGGNTATPNLQPAGLRSNTVVTTSNPKISYGTDYKVLFNYNNSRSCSLNDTILTSSLTNGSYAYSDPWNIFCQTYNNGATQYARFFWGKLYYLKIWLGETLVRDFVPALDDSNVPCLYDTITGQSYYNSGSGSFTYETLD